MIYDLTSTAIKYIIKHTTQTVNVILIYTIKVFFDKVTIHRRHHAHKSPYTRLHTHKSSYTRHHTHKSSLHVSIQRSHHAPYTQVTILFSYLMVAGAIDWNSCPEVLGITKGSIDGLVQYNFWSFPGPKGKCSSLLHLKPLNNRFIT